jgi:hypothetical protein
MEAAGRYGLMTLVHCENDSLVTAQTEMLIAEGKPLYAITVKPARHSRSKKLPHGCSSWPALPRPLS